MGVANELVFCKEMYDSILFYAFILNSSILSDLLLFSCNIKFEFNLNVFLDLSLWLFVIEAF